MIKQHKYFDKLLNSDKELIVFRGPLKSGKTTLCAFKFIKEQPEKCFYANVSKLDNFLTVLINDFGYSVIERNSNYGTRISVTVKKDNHECIIYLDRNRLVGKTIDLAIFDDFYGYDVPTNKYILVDTNVFDESIDFINNHNCDIEIIGIQEMLNSDIISYEAINKYKQLYSKKAFNYYIDILNELPDDTIDVAKELVDIDD